MNGEKQEIVLEMLLMKPHAGPADEADMDMDTGVTVLDTEVQTDQDEVSLLRSSLNNALQQLHQLKEKVNHLTPFTELSMKDKSNDLFNLYMQV